MFKVNLQETLREREEKVLEKWRVEQTFKKSIEQRQGRPLFSSFDGPPFATGLPHYGHLLTSTIKDAVFRYKTMRGFLVPRRFGWDCHGLPVENEIEKMKGLSGASSIEQFGIGAFNEECRGIVLRYTKEWEETIHRIGRFVSFEDAYRTMDKDFMESVWWVFGQLFTQGLVYEGFRVMPFSAKLGTPLSNFEANLNYKEVDDPSLTIRLSLTSDPRTFFLIWTTTPWSLPANLGIMVHPEIDYVTIEEKKSGDRYILALSKLKSYFKEESSYAILASFKGKKLEGLKYTPPFDYFISKAPSNAFSVLLEESISEEEGTGLVHSAPAFGEVDFYASAKVGIDPICPIDQNGKFTSEVPEYQGLFAKDADKDIIRHLKDAKKVFHQGTIRHRYPFCWRSDTPLLYKVVRTWFISVEKIKEKLLAANQQIHWVPSHIKEGRFGKWLENARDWAISRNRYWGTPLPIWRSADGDIRVLSSVEELEKLTNTKVHDLHRHHIDHLTFEENGKHFERVKEVFDCWFESGSMPYAQNHFPFENKEETMQAFPADFIVEGLDQTRGWFYTLTVLAAALYEKPAFKHVIVNGIILAEDGAKMSKRLKNYPEPRILIDAYGADALRLYLLQSGSTMAEDLKFSERGVEQVVRQLLIPLWNAYVFLSTYATIYAWKPSSLSQKPSHAEIDLWIVSLTMKLQKDVENAMENYQLTLAVQPLFAFVDQLTNWYIRRSRSRFWADEDSQDRRDSFKTLYEVLLQVSHITAPFAPFIAEAIYGGLKSLSMPSSVHLGEFPHYISSLRSEDLEERMAFLQTVISEGHALRKEHKLKVRQPLQGVYIVSANSKVLEALKKGEQLIADELNVKNVFFEEKEDAFVSLKGKANFRSLGKKAGPLMGTLKSLIEQLDSKRLLILEHGHDLVIPLEEGSFVLSPEDVLLTREALPGLVASSKGDVTIALDTSLNEPLLLEGLARELVNKVNTMRREGGFAVTDRIFLTLRATERLHTALALHKNYIEHEVLAVSISFTTKESGDLWDLNGEPTYIEIVKA